MRRGVRDLAFLSVVGGASGGAVDVTGLIGYWKFDGDLIDSIGAVNLSESGAGEVVYDTGILGQAVALDGPANTLGASGATALNTTDALTVSCWVKVTNAGSTIGGQVIARTALPSLNGSWGIEFLSGSRVPALRIGGSSVSSSGGAMSLNDWHHIVATYDRTNMKIYVDGLLTGTTANTNAVGTSGGLYVLGGLGSSSAYLDEASVWSRALSQAEVTALYNDGVGLSLT